MEAAFPYLHSLDSIQLYLLRDYSFLISDTLILFSFDPLGQFSDKSFRSKAAALLSFERFFSLHLHLGHHCHLRKTQLIFLHRSHFSWICHHSHICILILSLTSWPENSGPPHFNFELWMKFLVVTWYSRVPRVGPMPQGQELANNSNWSSCFSHRSPHSY